MVQFQGQSKLRKQCLQILIKMVNPKEVEELQEEFKKIDTNGDGTLDQKELRDAVSSIHPDMPAKDIQRIVGEIDANGDGVIDYQEFIAATFPVDQYASMDILKRLFRQFDLDGTGQLTTSSLADAFDRLGLELSD